MVLLMRLLLLLSIFAAGCGRLEYEVLEVEFFSGNVEYSCPNGEQVTVASSSEQDEISRACLGLTGCSTAISSADDPRCTDTNTNPLRGTCVETFFSCYRPAGTCSELTDGFAWSDGGRREGDAFYPPDGAEPCLFSGSAERAYFKVPD